MVGSPQAADQFKAQHSEEFEMEKSLTVRVETESRHSGDRKADIVIMVSSWLACFFDVDQLSPLFFLCVVCWEWMGGDWACM